jgi:L-threonylcarbamoyladenylate synthase
VLDGGPCELGIESTIVDCSRGAAALLRPGQIDRVSIESVLGHALHEAGPDAPRASGTLAAHYAPRANLRLLDAGALRSALEVLATAPPSKGLAVYSRSVRHAPPGIHLRLMPDQADKVAHELFSVLRGFDDLGARLIVETPPPARVGCTGSPTPGGVMGIRSHSSKIFRPRSTWHTSRVHHLRRRCWSRGGGTSQTPCADRRRLR